MCALQLGRTYPVVPCEHSHLQMHINACCAPQFLDAVSQLGVLQATATTVLDLMNVEGLTKTAVNTHLQARPNQPMPAGEDK